MAIELGDRVPILTFQQPDGAPLRLAQLKAPALLLVFLRHLA